MSTAAAAEPRRVQRSTLRVLAWPGLGARRSNPYTWLLYSHLAPLGVRSEGLHRVVAGLRERASRRPERVDPRRHARDARRREPSAQCCSVDAQRVERRPPRVGGRGGELDLPARLDRDAAPGGERATVERGAQQLVRVHVALGRAYRARGERDKAENELRMALWSKDDPQVRLELATLLKEMARPDEARKEAQRVLQADPKNAAAQALAQ